MLVYGEETRVLINSILIDFKMKEHAIGGTCDEIVMLTLLRNDV